ncbi:hypothetical protein COOONC_15923 [Cooperia oncophora]
MVRLGGINRSGLSRLFAILLVFVRVLKENYKFDLTNQHRAELNQYLQMVIEKLVDNDAAVYQYLSVLKLATNRDLSPNLYPVLYTFAVVVMQDSHTLPPEILKQYEASPAIKGSPLSMHEIRRLIHERIQLKITAEFKEYQYVETVFGKPSDYEELVAHAIKVRNETLKIADKHPGVFSFIDSKKRTELVKSADPFLSEFLEQVQKEEKRVKKKRTTFPASSSQPFRGRDSTWRPDSGLSNTCQETSLTSAWSAADTETAWRLARLTRNSGEASPRDLEVVLPLRFTITSLCGMALEPNALVLDTIINGYTIPFETVLEPLPRVENRKSARMNAAFKSLFAINSFSTLCVAEGKKLRLVLDLSALNRILTREHVKFDDLARVQHLSPREGFMTTFDLKGGYHHIRFCPSVWQLRLIFLQKCLDPLVRKWRGEGKGVAMYLDDGLIWPVPGTNAKEYQPLLETISDVLAEDKCRWFPTTRTIWLGYAIDLKQFEISISVERIDRAIVLLRRMLKERAPSLHTRLRWTGTLASMSLVISDQDKRQSRSVATEVAAAQSRECSLGYRWSLSTREKRDRFSDKSTKAGLFSSLSPSKELSMPDFTIEVDASAHSVGAVLKGEDTNLAQVENCLRYISVCLHLAPHFRVTFLLKTDNQGACRIHKVGSLIEDLQKQAEGIWELETWYPLWLVPPPSLVAKSLSWARHHQSLGILGCPYWPSQAYFLILKPDGQRWANFVRNGVLFPVGSRLFEPCPNSKVLNSEFPKVRFLFLLIDFREAKLPRRELNF